MTHLISFSVSSGMMLPHALTVLGGASFLPYFVSASESESDSKATVGERVREAISAIAEEVLIFAALYATSYVMEHCEFSASEGEWKVDCDFFGNKPMEKLDPKRVHDAKEILGLNPDDALDIKACQKAFRELARRHHPDKNPGDHEAHARFIRLGEAKATLGC